MSERPTGSDVGELLAVVRRTAGISQADLARRIGCSVQTVIRWEEEAPEALVTLFEWMRVCRHSLLPRNLDSHQS